VAGLLQSCRLQVERCENTCGQAPDFRVTYIGGRNKNRHKNKRIPNLRGPGGKVPVLGAISRKGSVVAQIAEGLDTKTLTAFVHKVVSDKVSLLATDEHPSYVHLRETFPHESVDHSKEEYVRGLVHTGTIDGFWSLLKREIMGNFHHVSRKYLPLSLAEFQFRHNLPDNDDMFGIAIAGC